MDDKVKQLLERIRDTACEAADTAADTARAAGRRAGQMVDAAKLNVQLFDLNGDLDNVLRRLGRVMYNTHLGKSPEGDPVTGLLEEADRLTAKIDEVKARVEALRHVKNCPGCGAPCGCDDSFCRRCGASLH